MIVGSKLKRYRESLDPMEHKVSKSIYVAGMWSQKDVLLAKMGELKSLGYNITSNWPHFENRLGNPDDYAECSRLDIEGVMTADTILVFMTDPKYPYRGTCTEIGCAMGSGKRIIIICDGVSEAHVMPDHIKYTHSHYCMENVFFWDKRIEHVSSYEDALKLLRGETVNNRFKDLYTGKISDAFDKIKR
jgi:nucleoside 2-deoxyribosyltransferase